MEPFELVNDKLPKLWKLKTFIWVVLTLNKQQNSGEEAQSRYIASEQPYIARSAPILKKINSFAECK